MKKFEINKTYRTRLLGCGMGYDSILETKVLDREGDIITVKLSGEPNKMTFKVSEYQDYEIFHPYGKVAGEPTVRAWS